MMIFTYLKGKMTCQPLRIGIKIAQKGHWTRFRTGGQGCRVNSQKLGILKALPRKNRGRGNEINVLFHGIIS